jgi:4-hydroxy-tetrahydrodipicolinate synthase
VIHGESKNNSLSRIIKLFSRRIFFMKAKYLTPAVTAFKEDGNIDYNSLAKLYDHLIEGGVDGILILGSIGEFFAISYESKKELIQFACKHINNRVELIVGTTSMEVNEIVDLSNYALQCGADAVMVIPPYYFHFTEESVFNYYDYIAESVKGNLYLYNFPDRTGYEISPQVVLSLVEKHENIIGIKDTISGMDHTRELIKKIKSKRPEFLIYSGFDDNFAHNIMSGGDGCIAGISNIYPKLTSAWVKAFHNNDLEEVARISQRIDKLMDIYGVGKPFVPYIKKALVLENIIECDYATFPMPKVTKEQEEKLIDILNRN